MCFLKIISIIFMAQGQRISVAKQADLMFITPFIFLFGSILRIGFDRLIMGLIKKLIGRPRFISIMALTICLPHLQKKMVCGVPLFLRRIVRLVLFLRIVKRL